MHIIQLRRSSRAVCLLGMLCLVWPVPVQALDPTHPDSPRSRIVAVFAGHTDSLKWNGNHQGVKSASRVWEYRYNDRVAALFEQRSTPEIQYRIFPASLNIPYQSRAGVAALLGAQALIEIHHDGVQPSIARSLVHAGPTDPRLAYYRGFSLHVFPSSRSIALAREIESSMLATGCTSSTYHQEDIPGERMILVPGTKATYERNGIALLKRARMPVVIIECGCICNPQEDALLKERDYQMKIVDAVNRAVESFFRNNQP